MPEMDSLEMIRVHLGKIEERLLRNYQKDGVFPKELSYAMFHIYAAMGLIDVADGKRDFDEVLDGIEWLHYLSQREQRGTVC